MNVLIINGHPRRGSFSEALADAYFEGAAAAGVNITKLTLANLSFNPNVTHISPRNQLFEDDIKQSQNLIEGAHHIVFVYPSWWGTMPALLKGFIDRVFTAGFAFEDIEGGTGYAPLLRGKSAQIITTMDTPKWVNKWIYCSPGHNVMERATLQFCGFDMAPAVSFGPLKNSIKAEREQWLIRAQNEGLKLRRGALSKWNRFRIKSIVWLKAIRLQFYPMTFVAYTAGALGAQALGHVFKKPVFWLGYLWLFLIEIATVLTNDYYDFNSDKQNKYFSSFTGGSRVIPKATGNLIYAVIPHGAFLIILLYRYVKNPSPSFRIDSLMIASLTYLIWLALIPLINLY